LAGNGRLGYLTEQQFEIACEVVDEKKPGYVEVSDKVSFLDKIKNIMLNFGDKFAPDKI
jgi:hypothetical protein